MNNSTKVAQSIRGLATRSLNPPLKTRTPGDGERGGSSLAAAKPLLALLLLPLLVISGNAAAGEHRHGEGRHLSKMLVFGDSLSDTGNAFVGSGGIITPPPYFEGRASDGPVAVEEAAKRLGLPAPEASLLGGNNFAFFGGTTLGPSLAGTPSLGLQVDSLFSEGPALNGDELIVIWGGANDAFGFFFSGGDLGNDPVTAAKNISTHITRLAAAGGKVFLVPNMARLSRVPLFQLIPELAPLAPAFDAWTLAFNAELHAELDVLEPTLGVTILQFDWNKWTDEVFAQPRKFGLNNITEPACPACGDGDPMPDAGSSVVVQPNKYFFWDLVHPTAAAHKLLGKSLAEFVKRELDNEDRDGGCDGRKFHGMGVSRSH